MTSTRPQKLLPRLRAAKPLTINGTTYYTEGANFKLTLNTTTNDDWHQITGIKGAIKNSDSSFNYTVGSAALEIDDLPKIGSLAFDSETNTYTIADKNDLQALADFVEAGHDCAGLKFKVTAEGKSSNHYDIQNSQYQIGTICAETDKFTFGDTTYYKSGAELTSTRDNS